MGSFVKYITSWVTLCLPWYDRHMIIDIHQKGWDHVKVVSVWKIVTLLCYTILVEFDICKIMLMCNGARKCMTYDRTQRVKVILESFQCPDGMILCENSFEWPIREYSQEGHIWAKYIWFGWCMHGTLGQLKKGGPCRHLFKYSENIIL